VGDYGRVESPKHAIYKQSEIDETKRLGIVAWYPWLAPFMFESIKAAPARRPNQAAAHFTRFAGVLQLELAQRMSGHPGRGRETDRMPDSTPTEAKVLACRAGKKVLRRR